jgi:preprotein translocase subunit SecD
MVLTVCGCTSVVAGTAQQTPAAPRAVSPERIQFRLVLEDVTDTGTVPPSSRSEAGSGGGISTVPGTAVRPSSAPDGSMVMADLQGHRFLLGPVKLDGSQIDAAVSAPNPESSGDWEVDITMTATGTAAFTELTRVNTGQRFAIVVGNVVVSAPRISSVIDQGQVRITGKFSQASAGQLATSIKGR